MDPTNLIKLYLKAGGVVAGVLALDRVAMLYRSKLLSDPNVSKTELLVAFGKDAAMNFAAWPLSLYRVGMAIYDNGAAGIPIVGQFMTRPVLPVPDAKTASQVIASRSADIKAALQQNGSASGGRGLRA